jgi:uncharacterized membrane protein HdeD (DUF308 family)
MSDFAAKWAESIARPFAERWWTVALQGLFALLFGAVALLLPGVTMLSLVLLFAVYAMINGVAGLALAARCIGTGCGWRHWAPVLLHGLVSIVAALFAVLWPPITVLAFVILLAVWSVISGVAMLASAMRLETSHGRVWLILGGLLSILFGAALVVAPMVGAVVLTWWVGAYALVLGGAQLAMAFTLRSRSRNVEYPPPPRAA